MQLIPVIEISQGKCVHTEPKNQYRSKVVSEAVLDRVAEWVEQGVERLHFVDVDAVRSLEPENVMSLRKIRTAFPELEIQVLGGIRSVESADIWNEAGADRFVLSSRALRNKDFIEDLCLEFPERVLMEIDSRDGAVNLSADYSVNIVTLAKELVEDGVSGLIVTHVAQNGQSASGGLMIINELARSISIPVIANGGIKLLADLERVMMADSRHLYGLLLGKPLYLGGIDISQARDLIGQYQVA